MAPRSLIWRYFTKVSKELAKCNICSKNLKTSGTTSNLSNHLKQKHSLIYKEYQSESEKQSRASESVSKRGHVQDTEPSDSEEPHKVRLIF